MDNFSVAAAVERLVTVAEANCLIDQGDGLKQ